MREHASIVMKGLTATLVVAVASLAACGSEPEVRPSGPSMSAASTPTPEARAANGAPVVESIELVPAEPTAGQPVAANVTASDPDGDPISFRYEWSVSGVRLKANGNKVSLTDARKGDLLELSVRASDGTSMSEAFSQRVRLGNHEPRIAGLSFQPPGDIRAGRTVRAQPMAEDRDGDALEFEYRWLVNGVEIDETSDSLSTEGMSRGDTIAVRVIASDGESESAEFSSPAIELGNAPPQVARTPIESNDSKGFSYRVPATDPDGDSMRFRLKQAPEGMEISGTRGQIAWNPTASQGGAHTVVVEIDDLHGGVLVHSFSLNVGVETQDSAPAAIAE